MGLFNRFTRSITILAYALVLPLNSALAEELPSLDIPPKGGFYRLESTQNKSFLIHACSSENDKCPIVAEVAATHLEAFLDEIASRQNPASTQPNIYLITGFGLAVLTAVVYAKYRKTFAAIGLGLGSGSLSVYGNRLASDNRRTKGHYREFETQILTGTIGKGGKIGFFTSQDKSNQRILEEFTDFINQYGIPVEKEAL